MNWSEFVDFWNRTKDIYDEKRDDGEKHRRSRAVPHNREKEWKEECDI